MGGWRSTSRTSARGLTRSVRVVQQGHRSLESRVLVTARRLKDKGVDGPGGTAGAGHDRPPPRPLGARSWLVSSTTIGGRCGREGLTPLSNRRRHRDEGAHFELTGRNRVVRRPPTPPHATPPSSAAAPVMVRAAPRSHHPLDAHAGALGRRRLPGPARRRPRGGAPRARQRPGPSDRSGCRHRGGARANRAVHDSADAREVVDTHFHVVRAT